jgi:hypothetical protein
MDQFTLGQGFFLNAGLQEQYVSRRVDWAVEKKKMQSMECLSQSALITQRSEIFWRDIASIGLYSILEDKNWADRT